MDRLNGDLRSIYEWPLIIQLQTNPGKSKAIFFCNQEIIDLHNIVMNGELVVYCDSFKSLGLVIHRM